MDRDASRENVQYIGDFDIGTDRTLALRGGQQRAERMMEAVARAAKQCLRPAVIGLDHIAERLATRGRHDHVGADREERGTGIRRVEIFGGQCREPVDALLHNRFQQIGFRGEMPIDGARAHPGPAGDLGQRHRDALFGESALRGGQHQRAIAAGIGPRGDYRRRWSG